MVIVLRETLNACDYAIFCVQWSPSKRSHRTGWRPTLAPLLAEIAYSNNLKRDTTMFPSIISSASSPRSLGHERAPPRRVPTLHHRCRDGAGAGGQARHLAVFRATFLARTCARRDRAAGECWCDLLDGCGLLSRRLGQRGAAPSPTASSRADLLTARACSSTSQHPSAARRADPRRRRQRSSRVGTVTAQAPSTDVVAARRPQPARTCSTPPTVAVEQQRSVTWWSRGSPRLRAQRRRAVSTSRAVELFDILCRAPRDAQAGFEMLVQQMPHYLRSRHRCATMPISCGVRNLPRGHGRRSPGY